MKKLSIFFLIFSVSMLAGCLRRAIDTSLPYYDGILKGKVEFPISGGEYSNGKDIILISSDSNVNYIVKKIEVGDDGNYSVDLPPGEYYLSVFRDINGDGDYTFGREPIGGRLAHTYDYFRTFHPVLEKAKSIELNPVLLRPFGLNYPKDNGNNEELTPKFSWSGVETIEKYRIRVMDRSGKTMWTFDTPKTIYTYGQREEVGEETVVASENLVHSQTYLWLVVGLKKSGDEFHVVAYSPIWSFTVKPLPSVE